MVAAELAGVGGRCLDDGQEAPVVEDDARASPGVKRWALDRVAAEQLWEASTALLRLR